MSHKKKKETKKKPLTSPILLNSNISPIPPCNKSTNNRTMSTETPYSSMVINKWHTSDKQIIYYDLPLGHMHKFIFLAMTKMSFFHDLICVYNLLFNFTNFIFFYGFYLTSWFINPNQFWIIEAWLTSKMPTYNFYLHPWLKSS